MKDNVLRLLDRSGQLMIQTTRSRNKLYKVVLQADAIQCLQVKAFTESLMWHARLGHVNTETMKLMINREIVNGIPSIVIGKEACVSCLLGKQTRQSFPRSTSYRAKYPLELVHRDLWSYHAFYAREQAVCVRSDR